MNVRSAMRDTLALANPSKMLTGYDSLSYSHLENMLALVVEADAKEKPFTYGKLCRWLGWMQAAVVASGLASLDDMREMNRKYADDANEYEAAAERSGMTQAAWSIAELLKERVKVLQRHRPYGSEIAINELNNAVVAILLALSPSPDDALIRVDDMLARGVLSPPGSADKNRS